ncbi:hypothetical protein GUITHDRAFT_149049 [Guillardia theta CCMP2712]|uniref:Zn(2)-C6 fungal-type domain-containing protein n=1 Tax=Guillardia theta (strain CCMP2712) TaxID=905079 RepID=L1I7J6_GUITC|nr:hypothetical protein GUITHDRAFT_149049 [Guillardia theta CCMP2712]EKX31810.1 hypothetical protein GUITHDRAFT_149049 [Guillardia theta CCMP2712]|eukprot:XP_005818790.1 hypothetical protein GUITHDRAFT_149049 [Guillardia theta CCMP2712]
MARVDAQDSMPELSNACSHSFQGLHQVDDTSVVFFQETGGNLQPCQSVAEPSYAPASLHVINYASGYLDQGQGTVSQASGYLDQGQGTVSQGSGYLDQGQGTVSQGSGYLDQRTGNITTPQVGVSSHPSWSSNEGYSDQGLGSSVSGLSPGSFASDGCPSPEWSEDASELSAVASDSTLNLQQRSHQGDPWCDIGAHDYQFQLAGSAISRGEQIDFQDGGQDFPTFLSPAQNPFPIIDRSDKMLSRACSFCKKRKLKCSQVRPCGNCSMRGRSATCDATVVLPNSAPSCAVVQRPLYHSRSISFRDSDAFTRVLMAAKSVGINPMILRRIWEVGLNPDNFMSIILNMPPVMKAAFNEGCEVLSKRYILHLQKMRGQIAAPHPRSMQQQHLFSLVFDDAEAEIAHVSRMLGHERFLCFTFNPESGERIRCSLGADYAEIFGLHTEEFMARLASNDLPIPSTEIDMFCIVVYYFCNGLNETCDFYVRLDNYGSSKQHVPSIYRHTVVKEDDCWGRNIRTIYSFEPVTPEKFDVMVKYQPERVRPFSKLLGDERTYEQLLQSHKSDMQFRGKIAYWRKSGVQRKKLEVLGQHMMACFKEAAGKLSEVLESVGG